MRKAFALIISLVLIFVCVPGCSKKIKDIDKPEEPVTLEQVNTDGRYVARAYLESIFSNNRELFVSCYLDGFIDRIEKKSGKNVFEEYKTSLTSISATVTGTAFNDYREYTVENGFDAASMRSGISFLTGLNYSDIEQIQLQKITVFFKSGEETANSDFYYVVYKTGGKWYMLESYDGKMKF